MRKIMSERDEVTPELRAMEVGDVLEYPASRLVTVRVACSTIGMAECKKFKTRADRSTRTLTVTRVQ